MNIWIINPYGSLPNEGWRTYRSTMVANALIDAGHSVVQFISNFEHRSKVYRCKTYEVENVGPSYSIHLVPTTSYNSHISIRRVRYERSFGRNVKEIGKTLTPPDVVILAEPSICYYDLIIKWLKVDLRTKVIIDLIDIWPELFHLLVPPALDGLAQVLLSPLYFWRKRLYRMADGLIAVSKNYQEIALKINSFKEGSSSVVYWGLPQDAIQSTRSIADERIKQLIRSKNNEEVWCVYAGTLGENYDIKIVIESGKMLREKYGPNRFKLLIAGDGPLKSYCESHDDNISLFYLGRLPSEILAGLLENCDIALSTYKRRSTVAMPIKAFDYFAFGLPMVNSLQRDLGSIIEDYKVGVNYTPESASDLYKAICMLVDEPEMRNEMSKCAYLLAKEFEEKKQYQKFVSVVENVFNGS